MRENAADWFDVKDPETIEEAKEALLDNYRGEEQQGRYREEIYTGMYEINCGMTMSEYALNLSNQARYLKPPMSEREIIRCVKRHFEKDIAREIRPTTVKNIEELVTMLDEVEYENERTREI